MNGKPNHHRTTLTGSPNRPETATASPPGLFAEDTCPTLAPAKLIAPLKWHGGKHYLAERIVALMPPRCRTPNKPDPGDPGWLHYVEPYGGGLAVLLANNREDISEVVNDLDGRLMNFWRGLQDPKRFEQFRRRVQVTPFSEVEYQEAEDLEDAASFFIRNRQSLAGRMDAFGSLSRTRTRRGMNEQASAWLSVVDGLLDVHKRLRGVVILNQPALDVIRTEDGPRTLFYLDPPYVASTRVAPAVYRLEMTNRDHRDLLRLLETVEGKVMLSGYRSELYDEHLVGWTRHEFDVPNNAAGGRTKKRMIECLWCNFR